MTIVNTLIKPLLFLLIVITIGTTGYLVTGFKTSDEQFVINPDAGMKLQPKSKLIILGQPDQILKLHQFF